MESFLICTQLALGLLTTSLLSSPSSLAAIIDTTGNLDVLRIYSLLIMQLHQDSHLLRIQKDAVGSVDLAVDDLARKMLDRVKIMRVFDLEGVVEAMEEIGEGLEGKGEGEEMKNREQEVVVEKKSLTVPKRKTVIADSEDEDEDDEEMLFDNPAANIIPMPPLEVSKNPERSKTPERGEEGVDEGKVSFVLIDNLAHVLNPLLKKDYVHATAQSTHLLRTLTTLTRTHTLHTLLLNPAPLPLSRSPASTSTTAAPSTLTSHNQDPNIHHPAPPPQQQHSKPVPAKPPSIFGSVTNIPALSHILPRYLDLHVLVERLPKGKADAKVVYANGGGSVKKGVGMGIGIGGPRRKDGAGEMVCVVEVLNMREGSGVGAWGVFEEGGGQRA
ncbi:hypothetical protein K505DRAFT_360720 [Melanomma pulvis-pyrius CBS 109.77]|uniref:DNA recombination and repair protein Rad51-like C-terminal domain-containing protein n=1 Tax=Melanomma pulvis-pyrius CBS 109.77 TaxID=1314802 RepID=A0A6A6XFK4_9PLEO|nr:hypothetical protein K505DRAFT_360720 [Melanomma pulvis-pyrius CBS 109.77]